MRKERSTTVCLFPLEMEERSQQIVCYKVGNESAGLDLEKRECGDLKLACMLH